MNSTSRSTKVKRAISSVSVMYIGTTSRLREAKRNIYASRVKGSNRHRFVVFLRVLPFGATFSIVRGKSGFVKKKRHDLRETAGDAGCLRSTGVGATNGRPFFVSSVTATTRRSRICGRPMVAPTSAEIFGVWRCAGGERGRPMVAPTGGEVFGVCLGKTPGDQWSPLQVECFGERRCNEENAGMEGRGFARRHRDAAVRFCAAGVTLALAILKALRQRSDALKFLKEGYGERTFAKVLSPLFYVPSVFLRRGFYTCASQQKPPKRFWRGGAGECLFLKKELPRKHNTLTNTQTVNPFLSGYFFGRRRRRRTSWGARGAS